MKEQLKKTYLRNRISYLIILYIIVLIPLSYAAYTNYAYMKGGVSTQQTQVKFSSNYLELVNLEEAVIPVKTLQIENGKDAVTIMIDIHNFPRNHPDHCNEKNIEYTLSIGVKGSSEDYQFAEGYSYQFGTEIQEFCPDSENALILLPVTLVADTPSTREYSITIPRVDIKNIHLEIMAIPSEGPSEAATLNNQLAGDIYFVIIGDKTETFSWSGSFIDHIITEDDNYDDSTDYAAFNYAVTGVGAGTVIITWNADKYELDPHIIEQINAKDSNGTDTNSSNILVATINNTTEDIIQGQQTENSLTLKVDSTNRSNYYLLQFYRVGTPDEIRNETWNSLETEDFKFTSIGISP